MQENNFRLGAGLMIGATLVFSIQDGISRHLATEYNVYLVVMFRYWFFLVFVLALMARRRGGLRAALRPRFPRLQWLRGVLLALEICVMVLSFTVLGLVESHAVFACYPLLVAALSGPVLGEKVGWRRWTAIAIGFAGIMIILQPGVQVMSPKALIPLLAAVMFALYGLMTRFVAREDRTSVSLFWNGVGGAAVMTVIGLFHLEPMRGPDIGLMATLCVIGVLGQWMLVRALEAAEASSIQPLAYLQLVFVAGIGVMVFGETIETHVVIGAGVVVAAGLFTLWRTRQVTSKG